MFGAAAVLLVGPRLAGLVIDPVGLGSVVWFLYPVEPVPVTTVGNLNDGVAVPTDPPVDNPKVLEFARAGPVPVKLSPVFDVRGVVAEKRAVVVWLLLAAAAVVVGLLHSWLLQGTWMMLVWYTLCVEIMFTVVVVVCLPPPCCADVVEEPWLLLPSLTMPNWVLYW